MIGVNTTSGCTRGAGGTVHRVVAGAWRWTAVGVVSALLDGCELNGKCFGVCADTAASGTSEVCGTDRCYEEDADGSLPAEYKMFESSYACQASPINYPDESPTFKLNTTLFSGYVTNNGGALPAGAVKAAWDLAVSSWTPASNAPRISIPSTEDNYVVRASEGDDAQAVIMTVGYYDGNPDTNAMAFTDCYELTGEVCAHNECDITLYTKYKWGTIPWSSNSYADPGYASISRAMVHELGHALGLGDDNGTSFPDSVMQDWDSAAEPGWSYRSPATADLQALVWVYGG